MSDIFHRPEYSKHDYMEEDDLVGTPYNGQLKDLGVSETRARTGAGFGAHHFSLSRYGGVNGAGNQVIDGSYHVGEDGTVYDNSFFLSDGSLSFANGCARGDHRHRSPGVGRRCAGGSPAMAPLDPRPSWLPSSLRVRFSSRRRRGGAAAAKALGSLEMAPDRLDGRADPGAGPPERTAPGPGPRA